MPNRPTLAVVALLALCAVLPASFAVADDSVCRRPCQFFIPQKGEAYPAAMGCDDLIDNLSGTCGVSAWDLPAENEVVITVQSHARAAGDQHRAHRPRLWIELG